MSIGKLPIPVGSGRDHKVDRGVAPCGVWQKMQICVSEAAMLAPLVAPLDKL